ncbi:MAG: SH3 domain-containing protein [Pseudobdellovibrionaceae bacterium]
MLYSIWIGLNILALLLRIPKFVGTLAFAFLFLLCTEAGAQNVCTNKDGVKLREAPRATSKQSWVVGKFMPFQVVGRSGPWLQVTDLQNQRHWVATSDVSSRTRCLVVANSTTALRKGPDRSHASAEPFAIADRYTPFKDLGGEDGWIKVQDSMGLQSWISLDAVWKPTMRTRVDFFEN